MSAAVAMSPSTPEAQHEQQQGHGQSPMLQSPLMQIDQQQGQEPSQSKEIPLPQGRAPRYASPLTVHEARDALNDVAAIRGRIRIHTTDRSSTTIVVPSANGATENNNNGNAASSATTGAAASTTLLNASNNAIDADADATTNDNNSKRSSSRSLRQQQQEQQQQRKKAKSKHSKGSGAGGAGGGEGRDFNYELCCACGSGGELVCCESCPNAYHFSCTFPTLDPDNLPDGDWFCRHCTAKMAAAQVPTPREHPAYAGVLHALTFVNPIEFSLPPELVDLTAVRGGVAAADRVSATFSPLMVAADGEMLRDRDQCVVCDLPFECDSSVQPVASFDVPALAGVVARRTSDGGATSPQYQQPNAQALAFVGAVDPYRGNERTQHRNYADKRKCSWCDDSYHVYCVRPAVDPHAPVPTHWLCPRHFREPDANFPRQKLSKRVHALQQDPKWHRDVVAQRETQARASAAPMLFSAINPASSLRAAAATVAGVPPIGDNVRRVFVTSHEQMLDSDIARRTLAHVSTAERDLRAGVASLAATAFPDSMASDLPDHYQPLTDATAIPNVRADSLTGTTVAAISAAATATQARLNEAYSSASLLGSKRKLVNESDAVPNEQNTADDDEARRAMANLLLLFGNDNDATDDIKAEPTDDNDGFAGFEPRVAQRDRHELARILDGGPVDANCCDSLSQTFVQFLAWQQLQLLHIKHKEAIGVLRRKEQKTSTVSSSTTHAAPRTSVASRRTQLSSATHAAFINSSGPVDGGWGKRRGGMPRSSCENCYLKHYECRVPRGGVACLRCVSNGGHCSLTDARPMADYPVAATASRGSAAATGGRSTRRRGITRSSAADDELGASSTTLARSSNNVDDVDNGAATTAAASASAAASPNANAATTAATTATSEAASVAEPIEADTEETADAEPRDDDNFA